VWDVPVAIRRWDHDGKRNDGERDDDAVPEAQRVDLEPEIRVLVRVLGVQTVMRATQSQLPAKTRRISIMATIPRTRYWKRKNL